MGASCGGTRAPAGHPHPTKVSPAPVFYLAVSPDGRLLAVSSNNSRAVGRRDAQTRRQRLPRDEGLGPGHRASSPAAGCSSYNSPRSVSARAGWRSTGDVLVASGCCAGAAAISSWDARSGALRFRAHGGRDRSCLRALAPRRHAGRRHRRWARPVVGRAHRADTPGTDQGHVRRRSYQLAFSPNGRRARRPAPTASRSGTSTRTSASASAFPAGAWLGPEHRLRAQRPAADLPARARSSSGRRDRPTLQRFACRIAGRDLTPEEWRELLPNRPYRPVCTG